MKQLLLIGCGGHFRSCVDVIEAEGSFRVAGYVDVREKISPAASLGYERLGSDEDLVSLVGQFDAAFVTVGQIRDYQSRFRLFLTLLSIKAEIPVIKSPESYCSSRSKVGKGTILMHRSVVNTNVQIGENCIINSKALIEHDCTIGPHSHISTNASINGGVEIGQKCFIGSGTVVKEGIKIGDRAFIGAGQLVVSDVPAGHIRAAVNRQRKTE